MKFEISNLLEVNKDGKTTGPMSPMLFIKEMAAAMQFKWNRLGRIRFIGGMEADEINNWYEGPNRTASLTSCDTLICASVYKNDIWVCMFVDMGCEGVPVAMMYKTDFEKGMPVSVTQAYRKKTFHRHLSDEQITEIFRYAIDNIDTCLKIENNLKPLNVSEDEPK